MRVFSGAKRIALSRLLYGLLLVVLSGTAVLGIETRDSSVVGTYYWDPVNHITLEGGRFVWQYVTDEYIPSLALREGDRFALSDRYLSIARGDYALSRSHITLYVESDQAGLMLGPYLFVHDVAAQTITYGELTFSKGRLPASAAIGTGEAQPAATLAADQADLAYVCQFPGIFDGI